MYLVVVIWIALSIWLAVEGSKRKIGGAGAFFLSILLSPIIGFIAVFLSERKVIQPESAELSAKKIVNKKKNRKQALIVLFIVAAFIIVSILIKMVFYD